MYDSLFDNTIGAEGAGILGEMELKFWIFGILKLCFLFRVYGGWFECDCTRTSVSIADALSIIL